MATAAQPLQEYWSNDWFRQEFDDDHEEWVMVFRTQKKYDTFISYLKQELDNFALTKEERDFYRTDIIAFVNEIINYKKIILRLSPKQIKYLLDIQDMSNLYFILLTSRGGSKTMLSALISVWSCVTIDNYFQTALGGSFEQTKALSTQAATFIYESPRLALLVPRPPTVDKIIFDNGSLLSSLKASETSARSPHPSGLMLDEYVAMHPSIVRAARGQLAETSIGFYRHGRLIITSTAQDGPSINEFKEIYNRGWDIFLQKKKSKRWNYFRSYNWSSLDCTWKTEEELKNMLRIKESVSDEEWLVEYMGKFSTATGSIFKESDITYAVNNAKSPYYEYKSPHYPCWIGVDWGFSVNPTVVILVQKHSDNIIRVLDIESDLETDFDYWLDIIEDWCKEYNVVGVNADASHVGENVRLRKRGLPVSAINFKSVASYTIGNVSKSADYKSILLHNIRWMVQKHILEIHEQFSDLIDEMRKYQWKPQKEDKVKKPIKKGVDHVEAFQLALLNLREDAYVSTSMSAVNGRSILSASSKTYNIDESHIDPELVNEYVFGSVVNKDHDRRRRY